jgi:hypothetical protein
MPAAVPILRRVEASMADERVRHPRTSLTEHATRPAEACGYSSASQTWRPLVEPGMNVVGVAGDEIGQVKEVRAADFLVDRSGALGTAPASLVYLPFERIHVMLGDRITLDISSSQVDEHVTSASL